MTINRDTWHLLVPKNTTFGLPCPTCANGKLRVAPGGLSLFEPRHSADYHDNESWEPDNVSERWSARLVCDEIPCGEIVHLIGDMEVVEVEVDDDDGQIYRGARQEVLRIRSAFPAPPLFRISKNFPPRVRRELELAFRLYWMDASACVARLRTTVEAMLDHQKVPKEKLDKNGKMRRMDLVQRIKAFTAGAAHSDQLDGLRNIGNLGTHGGDDVDYGDLLDALDVLEFALSGIYDSKSINAKAAKLKAKKPGT
ncbi:DUF4145 domain-containing protein [Sphingopyxis sp.]|uniref:DUF4145 domain-containing protein n=1 Tax=Sphingopyxis sp. TaxID=1908224 RepID=UPI002ED892B5